MIYLTIDYPPSANRYWRNFRGRMVTSAAAREYKDAIKAQVQAAGIAPLDGPIAVTLHLHRPRRAGDLDNRIKIVNDALQGVCFGNDNQIVELHAYLRDDKKRPRAEVQIVQVENAA